jgi:branched-chain amino acid transport system substrate-binding protein
MARPRIAVSVAALAISSLVVAGCGSSDTAASGGGTPASPGSSSASAASGSPLDVFFINAQGSSTGSSYPQETQGAKAAVAYINNKLGGVDGHPINLATCFTDDTPASSTNCANKAVTAHPVVISAGTLATDNSVIAVTGKTEIPYVSNSGFTAETLTSKGKAFIASNYADAIATAAPILMKQNGVKKVGIIYVNVPAVSGGLLPLNEAALDKQGIKHDAYPVPYPSPDLSATMTAVQNAGDDAIMLQVDPVTCGAALNALKTFDYHISIYSGSACRTDSNNKLVSTLSQPAYSQLGALPTDSSDPDAAIIRGAFKTAGIEDKLKDQWAVDGFTDIMNIYGAMKKASAGGGAVTSASVVAALEAGGIHQFLMGPSAKFTCDGSVMPALPALCSLTALVGEWKGDKIEKVQSINGAEAMK